MRKRLKNLQKAKNNSGGLSAMESAESGERDRFGRQVGIKHFELGSCLVGEAGGELALGDLQF